MSNSVTNVSVKADRKHGGGGEIEPDERPDVSLVLPCLNEARTVGDCIDQAYRAFEASGYSGEVIVADNGSTDGSIEIACDRGARIVRVDRRGMGHAVLAGFEAARGDVLIKADADGQHDIEDLTSLVEPLENGSDVAVGNRFEGEIESGAMSPLHRYLGTPVLSGLGRLFFGSEAGDFNCGFRAIRREALESLDLKAGGMEFALEFIIKAEMSGLEIAEVPTRVFPDAPEREPHLRTWQDGWKQLRLLLLYSPEWLFVYPGLALVAGGLLFGAGIYTGGVAIGQFQFIGIHSLFYAALAVITGFQSVWFGVFTKIFGIREGVLPDHGAISSMLDRFKLEMGLVAGAVLAGTGLTGAGYSVWLWSETGFGRLDPTHSMWVVIPSFLGIALGIQIVMSSFFLGVLDLKSDDG